MKTWIFELFVVFYVLFAILFITNAPLIEVISVGAVLASFAHGQVSERLAEQEAARAAREQIAVDCYPWAKRYFIAKEILWFVYFAVKGSYAALGGVVLFLLYPLWRKFWRRIRPLNV